MDRLSGAISIFFFLALSGSWIPAVFGSAIAASTTPCSWGFKCANQRCIDDLLICDGTDDCGDYSDETNCTCTDFRCQNGRCVRMSWVCDGEDDCKDNSDERNCSAKDFCDNDGGCDHICTVTRAINGTPTGKQCRCRLGYYLRADGTTCEDVDECARGGVCAGQCHNTDGSYYCDCPVGLRMASDKKSCIDVDECKDVKDRNGGCEHLCRNTHGSYECDCKDGYVRSYMNPKHCTDIDECGEGVPNCHVCDNIPGGYTCSCITGFVQNANKTGCLDIDECKGDNGKCKHICNNLMGGYECECKQGFKARYPRSTDCVDIDECQPNNGLGPCKHQCINEPGSFRCICPKGQQLSVDGLSCEDIDECRQSGKHLCSHGCVNTFGSYKCTCRQNHYLDPDGKTCQDLNDFSVCGFSNTYSSIRENDAWQKTNPKDWPWTVHFVTSFGWITLPVDGCLGTILSSKWLITAEHCLTSEDLTVITNDGERMKVEGIHPLGKHSKIRLVKLQKAVTFSRNVRPICLPSQEDLKAKLRDRSKTVGMVLNKFGTTYEMKSVRIVRPRQCVAKKFNSRAWFCAGNDNNICPGDSGSPMMYNKQRTMYLGGILLWGKDILDGDCDSKLRYLAYSNLDKHIKTIRLLTGLK